ncbi:MAG: type II/IV secretion system protein [Firmicutes bacterium]|nr:type II/IV secretion system protein [Bacillota bacterium]
MSERGEEAVSAALRMALQPEVRPDLQPGPQAGMHEEPELAQLIPEAVARRLRIAPKSLAKGTLAVACPDAAVPGLELRRELELFTGLRVAMVPVGEAEFAALLARVYGRPTQSMEQVLHEVSAGLGDGVEVVAGPDEGEGVAGTGADSGGAYRLEDLANDAPVVRVVNSILSEAVQRRASDVHIEPLERGMRVRLRVDGVLYDMTPPPRRLYLGIVSRLKIMAGLDIAEKRLPQDGRIRIRLLGREMDLRVSTLPVMHGESVVLRLLDRDAGLLDLASLGLSVDGEHLFRQTLTLGHGIILVTGPTGSGKTTTLYAALSALNSPGKKIITIEDPVEYELPGINQVPVKPKIGFTFANGLRSIVRQDPDIIMVGEIRDAETAEIAIQSALTGHLVLSTLHTNDAPSAMTRLLEMGLEPYLVASTVRLVIAQRLVRLLCQACKRPGGQGFVAAGCPQCDGIGYWGRTGIYELLPVDEEVRNLVERRATSQEIRGWAVSHGMRGLLEDGMAKVQVGITSVEEVLRVANG